MSQRRTRTPRFVSEFTFGRGVEVYVLMLIASVAALIVLPVILVIAVWLLGPPLLAVLYSRPEPERNVVQLYGISAALGWATAAALWPALFLDAAFFAVLVSMFVTGLLGAVLAVVVVLLVSLRFPRERTPLRSS